MQIQEAPRELLSISIENQLPVELGDLSLSLFSFSEQFRRFIESETKDTFDSRLLIREVRQGSIIVDLVSNCGAIMPLLWEGAPLLEWLTRIHTLVEWLRNVDADRPNSVSNRDLENWGQILNPVAKDESSQMTISVNINGDNNQVAPIVINGSDAARMKRRVAQEIEPDHTAVAETYTKKVMTWYQTRFDSNSQTGNKALIETIYTKPLKVVFDREELKQKMTDNQSGFDKPWNQLAYVVDVEVEIVNGKPKVFKVIDYHPEDTFDPSDE